MGILGHARVLDRLRGALSRGDLHHALLFEGPSGVGKRAVAEWLVALANCRSPVTGEPCGACPPCRQLAAGTFPDAIRLEPDPEKATATIAVEDVREVIRVAGYHRYGGARRFVIVDPAEAMAPAAANALLKTLEEPPDGTGFILVATSVAGLLPTIRSRCQRVRFGPVAEADLAAWLVDRGVDDAVAVAARAEGCPGRALRLAGEGLVERMALRDGLLRALAGDVGGVFAFADDVAGDGGRAEWRPRVEALLEVIEDLVRDGARDAASGSDEPTDAVAAAWGRALWPQGVTVAARAIADARGELLSNASGKLVVSALVARLRAELGPARRAGLQNIQKVPGQV